MVMGPTFIAEKSAQEVPKPAFRAHFAVEGVNHPGAFESTKAE